MTILLLRPYATFAQGATVDIDHATEASLVAQGRATYTVNPGSTFAPLTAAEQQLLRNFIDVGLVPGIVPVNADITINSLNAVTYNAQTLVWSGAFTVTLSGGLPDGFGFAGRPPASGNASVAVTGGPTIDGSTSTITRALASNKLFAVQGIAANTYTATGT